jgi:site-specific recombinase XerD
MLQKIVQRGAPTVANDVLSWTRRIFDYGIKRHMLETNPTGALKLMTGGQEKSRERWLSREELVQFFQAMPMTKGFSRQTS